LLASRAPVIDACRHVVRGARTVVSLARRPVLFALVRALGEAWPGDVPRDMLAARAFGANLDDESHRARLRVDVGRLRAMVRALAGVSATKRGFVLAPRRAPCRRRAGGTSRREHAAVIASSPAVELGASACGWIQPAHRAAGTRHAGGRRQDAVVRPRASSSLSDPARAGIHDDLVYSLRCRETRTEA
jgi:hypothetical protein